MTEQELTEASVLASIVQRGAEFEGAFASVQRSHRFPFDLFVQIENLAEMGGVSISLIINQLIRCGLESVKKELPQEAVERMRFITEKQANRTTQTIKESSRKIPKKPKLPKGG